LTYGVNTFPLESLVNSRSQKRGGLRVLFLGSTQGNSTSLHYFTSLVRQGHSVYPFDPDPMWARHFADKVRIRLLKEPPPANVQASTSKVLSLCRDNQFDLVFVMSQNFLSADVLESIRRVSQKPPTIIFHSHDNVFSPGILTPPDFESAIRAYDFVFTTKSQNVVRYRALGQPNAHFLPSAYEPSVHRPIGGEHRTYHGPEFEVTFVGTYDHSREPLLEAIGWQRLHVWGDRWSRSPQYAEHPERIHPKAIYHFEYAEVLSHSQCALGLLREEAEDLHTQRTFEIPACGALQIAPRNAEIATFFKEGKEIVLFSSLEELKEKVDYYLSHPKARKEIARKGYERCLKDRHTYDDRVTEILKRIVGRQAFKLTG